MGPSANTTTPDGERRFRLLATGQIVSMLGTHVSGVGLSIVAFIETGSVWWLSIIYLASRVPALLVAAHAGAVADRADRRRIVLVADSVAGTATAGAAALHVAGALELWHVVVLAVVGSVANAYQDPAFQAAVPTLVPADRLDRANGLLQLGSALGALAGPVLAGALVAFVGIGGILVLDLVTFGVAVVATLLVRFPSPSGDPAPHVSMWATLRASWAYLDGPRRGLRRLVLAATAANLVLSMVNVLLLAALIPLVGEGGTGAVLSLGGVSMLASSALISAKGLPGRRVPVIAGSFACVGAGLVLMGVRANVVLVTVGMMCVLAAAPVLSAASATIHQAAVDAAWQGRVAALRRVAAEALVPVGVLVVAPLVESLAEPAMSAGGPLAGSVGLVLGVGEGRGVGLVFVAVGVTMTCLAWLIARDRLINDLDHRDAVDGVATRVQRSPSIR
jgi:MFS transporter, DHA3 family, macrolide efflux protein